MNIPRIAPFAAFVGLLALFLLSPAAGFGQTTATTAPVGYLQTQCLGNSDTLVALPFTRPAAFTGAVASVSGTGGNTISFTSAPNFTASQFVYAPTAATPVTDHFYLIVGPTSAALTGTLTVTQNSPTVTGTNSNFNTQLTAGDRITINDGYNLLSYTVASVDSATSLTLDRPFVDSAAPGGSTGSAAASPAKKVSPVATTTTTAKKIATPVKVTAPLVRDTGGTSLPGLSATFDHSPYEGRWYMVTANDASTVTVDLNGDALPSSLASTQVSVIPYWTLNTVFPGSDASVSYTPTTNFHSPNTEILIPDYSAATTNLSAQSVYYYANFSGNTGWRLFTDSVSTDHGNDILLPDAYFIVSNLNAAPTLPLTFRGSVPMNKLAVNLSSNSTQPEDNAVALNRPVPTTLNALGLTPSATNTAFVPTTNVHNLADQLIVYDDSTPAYNKSAAAVYFYYNGAWRLFTDAFSNDHGADVIPAAAAFTIEKAVSNGQTTTWVNSPNY